MVVNNTASAIGDVIQVASDQPIVGVQSITAVSEIITGQTVTRFFTKVFRYSTTKFLWSDWQPLTLGNLQAISVQPYEPVYFEFQYTRSGSDTTGLLSLEQLTVDCDLTSPTATVQYDQSLFSSLSSDQRESWLYAWCMAVLRKLYDPGIVARYITRGVESHNQISADQDYIDFWRTVTYVYGLVVEIARKVEHFYQDRSALSEFLSQRGVILNGQELYDELWYIARHYYDEMRQRATTQATQKHNHSGTIVNGEILRLIAKGDCDEMIYTAAQTKNVGWNLGNSSPCYKGIGHMNEFIRGYEQYPGNTPDLTKYPTFQTGGGSSVMTTIDFDISIPVIKIDATAGKKAGIGIDYPTVMTPPSMDKCIIVDPSLDYEIYFQAKHTGTPKNLLTFGVVAFDQYDNPIPLPYLDSSLGSGWKFFDKQKLNQRIFYEIRGLLFSALEPARTSPDDRLNIGFGHHLKMTPEVCKIVPYIAVDASAESGPSPIHVYAVRVAVARAPYSQGFINSNRVVFAWLKNNNNKIDYAKLIETLRNFFVPYNSALIFNNIGLSSQITQDIYWVDAANQPWTQGDGSPWLWY